ncbi:hypothetical protein OKW21_002441 [Catalinimonas alkaloidigena]|uniref:hypothetical protein n=1 Tax=Catalinimonas alkaloidigena TaxID=1075417 RepID=UPI002406B365|nr:hypothetical protein [Catalinimonas alkaloidigena]MDF9797178.1 hypothetical protein [Catalinimonas alkaloidigena]
MMRFPELEIQPNGAESFYNEYKDKLSEEKLLKGFSFAQACDDFQRHFNKYLISEKNSMYNMNNAIRKFFVDNKANRQSMMLFAIFVREHLEITNEMLLEKEYYELMHKFSATKTRLHQLLNMLMADNIESEKNELE